jgi:hypothetical protein
MRRLGVTLGVIVTLLLTTMGTAMAVPLNSYYAPGSFLYSTAQDLPIDTARTVAFRTFMATFPDQRTITWPKLNMNPNWAMSYDYGSAGDPVWKLRTASGGAWTGRLAILSSQGFHMSDSVVTSVPVGNQDRPMVIIDRVFGYTAQFADAVPSLATHTIRATGPGITWHGSNGLDSRNPRSDDNRNQTSRGRLIDAMVITREELDQAVAAGTGLGKVLHLYFVETRSAEGFVHPMAGAEKGKNGFGAEGLRVRLSDAGLRRAVAAGLTGAARAIAQTLHDNGAYLGDNSGSSTQIKLSQASHYRGTNLVSASGAPLTDALKGKVFWADFEVVTPGAQ